MRRVGNALLGILMATVLANPGCGDDDASSVCGNDVLEAEEQCDGADLGGQTCADLGFSAGTLSCSGTCQIDSGGCSDAVCGNGTAEVGESCDGSDLAGEACDTQGFVGGDLLCSGSCDGFVTTGCNRCGNAVIDPSEDCDGTELGANTCQTVGLGPGNLACTPECAFDTTECLPSCATLPDFLQCRDCLAEQFPLGYPLKLAVANCEYCEACFQDCDGVAFGCPGPQPPTDVCDGASDCGACLTCAGGNTCASETADCAAEPECQAFEVALQDCPG
jgi:hypothetical protein